MELTKAQQDLLRLEEYREAVIKPFFEEYEKAKAAVVEETGIGFMFQDPRGTVWSVSEWQGQMVRPKPFEVRRTRKVGEKGSFGISLKAARDAGFEVE